MLNLTLFKMRKAQVSTEFTILVAFMLFVFLIYMGAIQERTLDFAKNSDMVLLEEISQVILTEIDNTAFTENGFRRVFELPATLINKEYEVKICAFYASYKDVLDNTRNNHVDCGGSDVLIPEIIVKYTLQDNTVIRKISRNVVMDNPYGIKLGEMNCLRKENNVVYINNETYNCK